MMAMTLVSLILALGMFWHMQALWFWLLLVLWLLFLTWGNEMETIKNLAITVMSDCGCSEVNDRLVDRISERISNFVVSEEKAAYLAGVHSVESAQPKISKSDHLKILMLLSNLETLMLSKNERLHGGLHDDLIECIELLAKTVLSEG